MPIRPALRWLYPIDWPQLSRWVRFERAAGRCERCRRPHGALLACLADGRWFDDARLGWRDRCGRRARLPPQAELRQARLTRVALIAAHLDHDPTNNAPGNLRGLCQRCHMLHDRPHHQAQRRLTYRLRWALGDLFEGR